MCDDLEFGDCDACDAWEEWVEWEETLPPLAGGRPVEGEGWYDGNRSPLFVDCKESRLPSISVF